MFDDLQINCPPKPTQTTTAATATHSCQPPRHPNVLHGKVASDALSSAWSSKIVSHEKSLERLPRQQNETSTMQTNLRNLLLPHVDLFRRQHCVRLRTECIMVASFTEEQPQTCCRVHRRVRLLVTKKASKDFFDNKMKPRPCKPIYGIFCSPVTTTP
jgi:hypothetical protein